MAKITPVQIERPAKVDLVNLDPLSKAAQKVAQAFENLAKRTSETKARRLVEI